MMKKIVKGILLMTLLVGAFSCSKEETPNPPTPPIDNNIQQFVEVSREAGASTVTMTFSKQGAWVVYKGTSPETIDKTTKVAETSNSTVEIDGLDPQQRYYFEVVLDNDDRAIVAETGLAIAGQKNFRDLGGMITEDGKSIKWGMIYRSGELSTISEADVAYLGSIELKTLIDFRFEDEITEEPDVPLDGVEMINLPIEQGSFDRNQLIGWLFNNDTLAFDTLLIHANMAFVTDFQEEFGSFLQQLESGESLVYHCTAGKDRTGFATVLFLSALGVDKETILNDYMASNEYNAELIEGTIAGVNDAGLNGELLRPVLEVKLEYINKAYETIDNEYGGMSNYLDLLGVDIEKLKSLYLE